MECVILFRNTQNAAVGFIADGDEIAVFPNEDAAIDFARDGNSPVLRAFPYQVVLLDEL
jgi:hypothetical protein